MMSHQLSSAARFMLLFAQLLYMYYRMLDVGYILYIGLQLMHLKITAQMIG